MFRCNEEVDKNAVIKRLQTKLGKLHLELATFKVLSSLLKVFFSTLLHVVNNSGCMHRKS